MKHFPILITETFEKSLSRAEKEDILSQVATFSRDYEESKGHPERLAKYGLDKVEGRTYLKEVWKFKVSKGDRILFVKGKHIPWNSEGYDDALVFLAYCSHDEQIRKARNKTQTGEILTLDGFADHIAQNMVYDPEINSSKVFKYLDIHTLIQVEDLKGIFYLNEEQVSYVNKDYSPGLLFGTAGSGKTTIGIYKMIGLMKQNTGLRIGYFTYSSKLLSAAREIYETVLANEVPKTSSIGSSNQIDFYSMKDFLKYYTQKKQIIEYEGHGHFIGFRDWCNALKIQPQYKRFIEKAGFFDIWKDIRGLIKGFATVNWDVNVEQGKEGILSLESYLALKSQYTGFNKEERKILYEICLRYMEWLEAENLYDENDLSRMLFLERARLPKYDWLVIDEVQDLTEVEIALLYSLLQNKANILISGDYYQTITPTYFDTRRIKSLFIKNHLTAYDLPLQNNYRNPKVIVDTVNHIAKLRQQIFGIDKRNDKEEYVRCETEGDIFLMSQKDEKIKLLQIALEKAYVYIIVPNEEEKRLLEMQLEVDSGIYTVSEIKGLENEYIIAVNFFKAYERQWDHLLELIKGHRDREETYLDKHIFNSLYVALTRATKYVCLVDDFNRELIELLFKEKKVLERFDEESFNLAKKSTQLERYRSAYKLEELEHYEAAINYYKKLTLPEAKEAILRCQAGLLAESGEYEEAAKLYLDIDYMEKVIYCYKMAENKENYFKYLLLYAPKRFKREYLLNPKVNYEDEVKPYLLSDEVKESLQKMCKEMYVHKLEQEIEDKQLLIWEIESFTEKLVEKMTHLKGEADGGKEP
ncbi:MAG: AAA family ATPase [Candidatus Niameybacter stercoravium]|nr:AAA family ATPase [Candidatus Niameybacter stercoravium]